MSSKKQNRGGFFERVYEVVRRIPKGKVSTYGDVAKALGTRDARRVGHALHANPYEDEVPCHRVVNSKGEVSESFAFNGASEQVMRLKAERVEFLDEKKVNLLNHRYNILK